MRCEWSGEDSQAWRDKERVRRGAALKFRRDVTLEVVCWESCAAGQESSTTLQNKALQNKALRD
jgi:hypothetical protein